MGKEILGLVVGGDEPEALVVAEPLHGSSSHFISSCVVVLRTRRLLSKGYERWHCDVGQTTQPDRSTVAVTTTSSSRRALAPSIGLPPRLRPARPPAARSAAGGAARGRPRLRGGGAAR